VIHAVCVCVCVLRFELTQCVFLVWIVTHEASLLLMYSAQLTARRRRAVTAWHAFSGPSTGHDRPSVQNFSRGGEQNLVHIAGKQERGLKAQRPPAGKATRQAEQATRMQQQEQ
jgi:hypothetical protein